jgi:hypothetical protein
MLPADPVQAEDYLLLYALWQQLSERLDAGNLLSPGEFSDWEGQVRPCLRAAELSRFEKPLRPTVPISDDTIQYARAFHLTKILWARQGAEKLMTDTGY